MSAPAAPTPYSPAGETALSGWLVLLLATACGLIAANLYYAQPLIGLIAPDIGLDDRAASLIVTLTQLGYCAGLLLVVPLGDLVENRRLVLSSMVVVFVALLIAARAPSAAAFLAASLLIGIGSVAVQMLVPIASHLAPDAIRGRVVGNVMSGLLAGIMLARPVSSLIADRFGWHAVFGASAAMMVVLALVLARALPRRVPQAQHSYPQLIASLWTLLKSQPLLRRRALYQAAMFAAFSLYWTAVPLILAGPSFGLTQTGIAWFALAGVAGALAAPLAGRLADSGHTHVGTGLSIASVAVAFVLAGIGGHIASLPLLLFAGILLDFGVQANLVFGQRSIFTLGTHIRSRLNGLYMATFFAGGALGSAITSLCFTGGGWTLVSGVGTAFPLAALAFYATEKRER
jgi:predicted MFS family arabinose efflux permease